MTRKKLKVGDKVRVIHLPGIEDGPVCEIMEIYSDGMVVITNDQNYFAMVWKPYLERVEKDDGRE